MRRRLALALGVLSVAACAACSDSGSSTVGNTEHVDTAPTAARTTLAPASTSGATSTAAQTDVATTEAIGLEAFGPGEFVLGDPAIGVGDLGDHTATLVRSFEGTKDGQPYAWSVTDTLVASADGGRSLTTDATGDDATSGFVADVGGVTYELDREGLCIGYVADDSTPDPVTEPAAALASLIGAEAAGSEAVGGVDADHYTFDQRALGLGDDVATAVGEVWVAHDGGQVLRYTSTTNGTADYFGEGVEGTLIVDYELSLDPTEIALPQDCPPGLVDIPKLADAADIISSPGSLTYTTSSTLDDVDAFYADELPAAGWTFVDPMAAIPPELRELMPTQPPSESQRLSSFTRGAETLTLFTVVMDGRTNVTATLARS